jgi:hypothetical protein
MRLSSSSSHRQEDGSAKGDNRSKAKCEDVAVLPAQLGRKLRALYSVEDGEPASERLAELVEELAAKERMPE